MKREIKNDGVYVEVDASEILDNLEALKEAKIVVVTSARIELAGEDRLQFLSRFDNLNKNLEGFDSNRHRSDVIFRGMLIRKI